MTPRGVTKVDTLKNPKGSYARGSRDSPVSYALESLDFPGSYAPGVTKVDPLKNPKWSYALGSWDPPVSYAPVSRDPRVSYVPGSHDSQMKVSQIVDNYVTYSLWKFQIYSFKITA